MTLWNIDEQVIRISDTCVMHTPRLLQVMSAISFHQPNSSIIKARDVSITDKLSNVIQNIMAQHIPVMTEVIRSVYLRGGRCMRGWNRCVWVGARFCFMWWSQYPWFSDSSITVIQVTEHADMSLAGWTNILTPHHFDMLFFRNLGHCRDMKKWYHQKNIARLIRYITSITLDSPAMF